MAGSSYLFVFFCISIFLDALADASNKIRETFTAEEEDDNDGDYCYLDCSKLVEHINLSVPRREGTLNYLFLSSLSSFLSLSSLNAVRNSLPACPIPRASSGSFLPPKRISRTTAITMISVVPILLNMIVVHPLGYINYNHARINLGGINPVY